MSDEFDWGALGQDWWSENGEACHASEQQIKFACARHQGANRAKAALIAGYSGDAEALRSAGSRADDSKAVSDLLVLASTAESGLTDSPVTDQEVEKKISRLIRSPDGVLALKAIEARDRRLAAKAARETELSEPSIEDELKELEKISPALARAWAEHSGFPWSPTIKEVPPITPNDRS